MNWTAIWQWLDGAGLLKDILAWVVGLLMGGAWVYLKLMPHIWKHHETQAKILDALDTKTPGGLSDILKALQGPDDSMPSAPDSGPPSPLFQHSHIETPHIEPRSQK